MNDELWIAISDKSEMNCITTTGYPFDVLLSFIRFPSLKDELLPS
jgi:hypothetical protein